MAAFLKNGFKKSLETTLNTGNFLANTATVFAAENLLPCGNNKKELTDLVHFIIENSVVSDKDSDMINNLKKVTSMCDDDINNIIKAYKETPRYDEFEQDNEGKFVKKLLSQQDEHLTFRMLFKNNHLLNANFNNVNLILSKGYYENCNLRINIVVKSNGSNDYAIYYNGDDIIDATTLMYPLAGNHSDEVKKNPIYAYEFKKIILTKMPEGINYNEEEADQGGGKRKTKGKSKKVAKKPVVSQKKQSIYKEILGKQMKIYKMPDSRKEYVKYKGDLHLITHYKSLIMKQKAMAKPKAKAKPKPKPNPNPRNKI